MTACATGKSTTVTEDAKNGKQIWHEIEGEIPTTAGTHTVTVRSTNVHGQTIENTVTVILIGPPTVTPNTDGTVTVTPSQTDGVTKTVDVTYTDEAGVEKNVTATKGQDDNWTVPADSGVTVNPTTGAVTIPANSVQNGSTVKAVAKDSTNYPSTEATAEALNPATTVQDKQTIYVFNNTPIATVGSGSDEADNVNKVKVVTLQDPDGIKSVAVGEDGLGNEYKVDAEGYASGKPFVSALGKHGRSFAVTDNQGQVTNVLTATEDKQSTYVMDVSATGEITKAAGESATADEILAKVTVDPGNEREHIEGTVDGNPKYRKVLAPGQQVPTTPGTHTVTVRVITDSNVYKDVPVKVIIPKYSDTLTATAAENTSLVPGSGTAVTQPIVIKDKNDNLTTAPAVTTYEIDPAFKAEKEALGYEISVSPTGEVSVKAPAGQEADITVPVTVTYPDKTKDPVSVPFKVDQKGLAQLKATEALDEAATAAKKAIDNNPNLSEAEKQAAKDAVDADTEKAKQAVADATTIDEVDAAKEAGTTNVDGKLLDAAKLDAKNKIDKDVEAANAAIESNPNLSEKEIADAKAEVAKAAEDAKKAIDAATTPEAAQTAEDNGVKAIDAKELDAAKQDAKNKIAEEAAAAKDAIDKDPNLSDAEKTAAKNAVDTEVAKANDAIDKAKTPAEAQTAEDNGVKAIDAEELAAAKQDAKNKIAKDVEAAKDAIDNNPNLSDAEKQAAKDAVDAEVAKANDAIDAATKAAEVETATLVGEKAVAKEELKSAAEDAKVAIDANDNLTDAEKQAAKDAVDAEVAKANDAIDAATKADEVDAATLAGEKAVAKEELKAAAEDAKKAIDANDNLTPEEKAAAKDAVDAEVAKANDAIDANDAATKADEVDAATLAGEKAVAKEEVKAAAADAKAAIDANDNLTPEEKAAAKDAVDAEVAKANDAIDAATKADEVETATLVGEKALAKEELKAAAEDAKKAIDANDNLTDAEKQAAKDAVDAEVAKAEEAIDAATSADEVDAATLAGEKAVAKEELKAAVEDAKKAIDANPNLSDAEKAAAKAEIDKAVEEAIIAINGAGTHHALGEIKLPLSALIKPVVTVTPVLDPNNLTEEEIARIKALLEENNTFPEGTEIIVSKDASVSIKYPDGSIDLVLPAEIVKQADTTAPAITDDAKGNIVVAPTKEAVEFVVTYVDNNGKAQLVIVTKGADGKWTTTAKAVIVDPVTGQVIIPGSAIKPGTVVTAYSKDMAGNVSDLNSAEVEAVDANNPAAGVKVKSVTSTSNANKSTKKAKQLPNTGEKATSATSLGLAVLGMGLALFAAKRKKDEEEA
ncbi:DUF1542 domain-containing protein [Streptococcus suis]|nr:DUF1542 domain-containing protein [Streptococcus suis]